jgi:hypothetical protein
MIVSAELRWFWNGEPPAAFVTWFRQTSAPHPCGCGGGTPRRDDYLRDPTQTELGVKARSVEVGGRRNTDLEIKALVARLPDAIPDGPFFSQVEIWTKVSSSALALAPGSIISTTKTRWMRKFDTGGTTPREVELDDNGMPRAGEPPARGCNVELTKVEVRGRTAWTFGFESFGDLTSLVSQLRDVASTLAARNPPALSGAIAASYPEWLRTL